MSQENRKTAQTILHGVVASAIFTAISALPFWSILTSHPIGQDGKYVYFLFGIAFWSLIGFGLFCIYGWLFKGEFNLNRRLESVLTFYLIIVIISSAPILSYLTYDLAIEKNRDNKVISIIQVASDSIAKVGVNEAPSRDNLTDLLKYCSHSIKQNGRYGDDIRVTVVFFDENSSTLRMPSGGYNGISFDSDIRTLEFDVSAKRADESEQTYKKRIGVAGYAFSSQQIIVDENVQAIDETKGYIYKKHLASEKDSADKGMMSIPFYKPNTTEKIAIGVLNVSTSKIHKFTSSDLGIAIFFSKLMPYFYPLIY